MFRLIRSAQKEPQSQSFIVVAMMAALMLLASPVSTGAEISSTSGSIYLQGTITKADPARFRAVAAKFSHVPRMNVQLNSAGGDVFAAIEIGRYIRSASMVTFVGSPKDYESARCVSACIFIFAGGVYRGAADKTLGIHRPYNTDTHISNPTELDKRYKQLDALTRTYFKEMNISEALANEMLRIPPEDVKFLTQAEAQQFGLEGSDPAYDDYLDSSMANIYGISKQEYYRRVQRRHSECTDWTAAGNVCRESIMRGISEQEYVLRSKRVSQCKNISVQYAFDCERAVYRGDK